MQKAKKEGAVVVKDVTEENDKDGIIKYAVLKTVSNFTIVISQCDCLKIAGKTCFHIIWSLQYTCTDNLLVLIFIIKLNKRHNITYQNQKLYTKINLLFFSTVTIPTP